MTPVDPVKCFFDKTRQHCAFHSNHSFSASPEPCNCVSRGELLSKATLCVIQVVHIYSSNLRLMTWRRILVHVAPDYNVFIILASSFLGLVLNLRLALLCNSSSPCITISAGMLSMLAVFSNAFIAI